MLSIANELMINEEITDREIRLIGENGEQLGVVSLEQARQLSFQKELDLVKIAPNAKPPVCKLMDYGKYRFEQSKREKEARKNQKIINMKEIRLSATIDTHDIAVKAKNAEKFLKQGDKLKVVIRFRGRQMSHSEIGREVMASFYDMIKDAAVIDRPARIEGRNMVMFLSPKN
ncbi:MAG: translation initiation factor IF-3 [Christensenellales bacterium]